MGAENLDLDPEKAAARLDERLRELTGFRLEETPLPYAKHVKVPTLMAQLRRDFLIHGEKDGQAIFDALGANEKELVWIEQSNQRFYAYNHFGHRPGCQWRTADHGAGPSGRQCVPRRPPPTAPPAATAIRPRTPAATLPSASKRHRFPSASQDPLPPTTSTRHRPQSNQKRPSQTASRLKSINNLALSN